jgi:aspartyl/asparaginyl-tRNA synthetase
LEKCPDEMAFFNAYIDKSVLEKLHKVVSSPFTKMEYTEGIKPFSKKPSRKATSSRTTISSGAWISKANTNAI